MLDRRELLKLFGIGTTAAVVPALAIYKETLAAPIAPELPLPEAPTPEVKVPLDQYQYELPLIVKDEEKSLSFKDAIKERHRRGCSELQNATIIFTDENDKSVTFQIGEGNLTWLESRDHIYKLDRGVLGTIGNAQPLELSLDIVYNFIQTAQEPWMQMIREASELHIEVQCDNKAYYFEHFRYESIEYSPMYAQFSISGRCCPDMYV